MVQRVSMDQLQVLFERQCSSVEILGDLDAKHEIQLLDDVLDTTLDLLVVDVEVDVALLP